MTTTTKVTKVKDTDTSYIMLEQCTMTQNSPLSEFKLNPENLWLIFGQNYAGESYKALCHCKKWNGVLNNVLS